nr:MAG TPA: hypothetical protein [Caudoviricetes sp.]
MPFYELNLLYSYCSKPPTDCQHFFHTFLDFFMACGKVRELIRRRSNNLL